MLRTYAKIPLGKRPVCIQCSSCLRVLGASSTEQGQAIFCFDCIKHSPKDDRRATAEMLRKKSRSVKLRKEDTVQPLNEMSRNVSQMSRKGCGKKYYSNAFHEHNNLANICGEHGCLCDKCKVDNESEAHIKGGCSWHEDGLLKNGDGTPTNFICNCKEFQQDNKSEVKPSGCGELIILEQSEGRTENGVCGIYGDYCDKCQQDLKGVKDDK